MIMTQLFHVTDLKTEIQNIEITSPKIYQAGWVEGVG